MITHLNFNYKKNKLIIDNFLKNILKNKFTGIIKKDLNSFNLMYYEKSDFKYLYSNVEDIILELKNNYYIIKKLDFPSVIPYFIENISASNYNNLHPFNDFFVSLSKPNFI